MIRTLVGTVSLLLAMHLAFGGSLSAQSPEFSLATKTKVVKGKPKRIKVIDVAQNSKAGAMVGQYFIGGMQAWPDAVVGKKVEVKGSLHLVQHKAEDLVNSKGEVSQGLVGEQYILENADWRILKD